MADGWIDRYLQGTLTPALMALSYTQRMILAGVSVGIVVGIVVGGIGAFFNIPAGVRGGLTGGFIVVGLSFLRKSMQRDAAAQKDSP